MEQADGLGLTMEQTDDGRSVRIDAREAAMIFDLHRCIMCQAYHMILTVY